jgi:hypothetical protein
MENKTNETTALINNNPKTEKQLFIDKLNTLLSEYDYPANLNDISDDDRVLWRIRDYGISQMLKKAREENEVAIDFADWIIKQEWKQGYEYWWKKDRKVTTQELFEIFQNAKK